MKPASRLGCGSAFRFVPFVSSLLVIPAPLCAQGVDGVVVTPRLGLVSYRAEVGEVPEGDDGFFEVGQVGEAFLIGFSIRYVLRNGWELEGSLLRATPSSTPSVHRCLEACLLIYETPTLDVSRTSLVATLAPPLSLGPMHLKLGVGIERFTARWPGGTNFGRGRTSDTRPSALLGVAARWFAADRVVELQLTGGGSGSSWEGESTFHPALSLSVGLGLRLDPGN